MTCKYCHGFDLRSHEEGFIVAISNLQSTCSFCSLLRSIVSHFAPCTEDAQLEPSLRIDMQECDATNVEVMITDLAEGPGSFKTAASFWVFCVSRR